MCSGRTGAAADHSLPALKPEGHQRHESLGFGGGGVSIGPSFLISKMDRTRKEGLDSMPSKPCAQLEC